MRKNMQLILVLLGIPFLVLASNVLAFKEEYADPGRLIGFTLIGWFSAYFTWWTIHNIRK